MIRQGTRFSVIAGLFALFLGLQAGRTGELLDFDPRNPPLPELGKQYRLVLNPGKGAAPATLIFSAGDEVFGEENGRKYTNISFLSQEGHGDLPFSNEGGLSDVEVVDYDSDGYLDFRILAGWGSGGSWYNYYRYDGQKYVSWEEPMALGISTIKPDEGLASAFWRSGPSYAVKYYRISKGRFVLYKEEVLDQVGYHRSKVPKDIPASNYVRIEEKIEGDRIIHRTITVQNPWEDDSEAKVVFDQTVDESVEKSRDAR